MEKYVRVRGIFRTAVVVGLFWGTGVGIASAQHVAVDTDYVVKNKDKPGVVVIETRPGGAYKKGMIPGAVILGEKGAAVELRDVDARMLPVKKLEKILGDAGLKRDSEIIVYGAKGDTGPGVVFWILEYLGADKAKVYMGGIDDWMKAKQPLSNDPRKPTAAQFVAKPRAEVLATTDFVKKNLKSKDIQFVDTRTTKESSGDDIRAVRGGHVAAVSHVNIPYEQAWVDPDTAKKLAEKTVTSTDGMDLKSAAALKELYKGLDPKKEVVTYCQTGTRSAYAYLVLREMGFQKVRNYDDSWIVWGSDQSLPVENVSYYDFVKVNAALKRLNALEQQVASMAKK